MDWTVARLWDLLGRQIAEFDFGGYNPTLSPDWQHLAIVGKDDDTVRLWCVDGLDQLLQGSLYNQNTGVWYIRTPSPVLSTAVIMRE